MNRLQEDILSLKQGVTAYGPAPHKPILLLAVIDLGDDDETFVPVAFDFSELEGYSFVC